MGGSGKSFFFIRDEEKQMLDDVLKLINPVSWGSVNAILIIPQNIILSNRNQRGFVQAWYLKKNGGVLDIFSNTPTPLINIFLHFQATIKCILIFFSKNNIFQRIFICTVACNMGSSKITIIDPWGHQKRPVDYFYDQ